MLMKKRSFVEGKGRGWEGGRVMAVEKFLLGNVPIILTQ